MSLSAPKDRTVKITLESDLKKNGSDVATYTSTKTRAVDKFLTHRGLSGYVTKALGVKRPTLFLRGVNAIDFDYTAGVAEAQGPGTSFLQPWSIKPVKISLKGMSYLGTYVGLGNGDKEVSDIYGKLKIALNDFSPKFGAAGTGERTLIEFTENPENCQKFLGYITGFKWSEQALEAYVLNYSFSFIGVPADDSALIVGKNNAQYDSKTAMGGN